jgi:adenylate cyclase
MGENVDGTQRQHQGTALGTTGGLQSNRVLAWLQSDGVKFKDTGQFVDKFASELLEAGVDLYRLTTGIHIIHPQIDASSTLWQKGKPVTERRWKMDRQALQNSPMEIVYSGRTYRARLDSPPEPGEFPVLTELRTEGVTEYFALPLPFSDGSWKAVSDASRRRLFRESSCPA